MGLYWFQLAFSHFDSHFHFSASIFTFRLTFSSFGSHFHVSAHIFTFRLAFSCFSSHFHVSARIFMFWLAFGKVEKASNITRTPTETPLSFSLSLLPPRGHTRERKQEKKARKKTSLWFFYMGVCMHVHMFCIPCMPICKWKCFLLFAFWNVNCKLRFW